ncbi:hypothetical protein [Streptomyces sp. NPDC056883]|uniref:hypothetical protein n=1 Tax=Streptomyces sp. NPDC056883 TaxID=3345959 RepID=UPI0036B16F6A
MMENCGGCGPVRPTGARGVNPYTVVLDWKCEWWEPGADDLRAYAGDEPTVFHVWADNPGDASDYSDEMAVEKFGGKTADYLKHVAILDGHAPLVRG